ncbi:11617_t:CDS:2 [Entrophospora sp. SA101]|nr:10180_t:CDS:2 [Entrophospora sp. SA101]CAJ0747601.1 11617_t:CDS:2 [Entrophospora sp. SA101]
MQNTTIDKLDEKLFLVSANLLWVISLAEQAQSAKNLSMCLKH